MQFNACAALIFGACCQLSGQPPQPLTNFEVASIRAHQGPLPRTGGSISISGPRLTIIGFRMSGLLWYAFDVKDYQIGNFASLDRTLYDIVATAADGRTRTGNEFKILMQALLAERFQLRVHREAKEMPVYALVVDKGGPKFGKSAPDAKDTVEFQTKGRSIGRTLSKTTMADLAEGIRNNAGLDRPVVDKTGLTGYYTLSLIYTPENRKSRGPEFDPSEIDIFTAVREQLGLRLEGQTGPVEMLIVDHVQRPSEN